MAYEKQTWNTQSYVTPTRMNHMEDGIAEAMPSENMALLGAKNLNVFPYYQTSRESAGVTFTINNDGTVSTSGTGTGGGSIQLHSRLQGNRNPLVLPNGTYILTGCPSGGSSTNYEITLTATIDGATSTLARDYGSGATFTLSGDDYSSNEVTVGMLIQTHTGINMNNKIFRPMIRKVGDINTTWFPYAMTNKQITDVIGNPPRNAGTYTLQCVVDSNGITTYSWV